MEIDCPSKCGARVKLKRIWYLRAGSPYRAVEDHASAAGLAKGNRRRCIGSGVNMRIDGEVRKANA